MSDLEKIENHESADKSKNHDLDILQKTLEANAKTQGKLLQLKEKISPNSKERQNTYTLSKKEFQKYFMTKEFSQTTGNCWLLSALKSIMNLESFESLIRSSVSIQYTNKGKIFSVKLPLGDPQGHVYTVSEEKLLPQMSITGEAATLIYADNPFEHKKVDDMYDATLKKLGLSAILHAFGQKTTGQTEFSFYDLEGGVPNNAFIELVHGLHIYHLQIPFRAKYTQDFHKAATATLGQFDPKQQACNLIVIQQEGGLTNFGSLEEKALFGTLNKLWNINHGIVLEEVIKNPDRSIKAIRISNPLYTGKSFVLSYPQCLKYIGEIQIGSIKPINGLQEFPSDIYGLRKKQKERVPYNKESLNDLIQMTRLTNYDERQKRGDVIIQAKRGGDGYKVYGRGKRDTSVVFKDETIRLRVGKHSLVCSPEDFSNSFDGDEDARFQHILYPARTLVFINKMRAEYIDKRLGKKANPFSIAYGQLMFANDPDKVDRGRTKHLHDDLYVLSSFGWDKLGIQKDEHKQKLCDFLNFLYNNILYNNKK